MISENDFKDICSFLMLFDLRDEKAAHLASSSVRACGRENVDIHFVDPDHIALGFHRRERLEDVA